MIKTFGKAAVFFVLCLLAVEQTYRFYSLGPVAFNPARFNSYNLLLYTDFIELSEYPDIYYQLKPDIDGWFQGNRLTTNSMGLADEAYPEIKPDNSLRVAVVGSSWTMATGVAQNSSWHAQLERRLNESNSDHDFEFINFGVEYYGLREMVATVRHRVLPLKPDVIHVDLTTFTAYLLWESPPANLPLPEQRSPFFQSFALRALDANLGTGFYSPLVPQRPTVDMDMTLLTAQVVRALREIHALATAVQARVTVSWLFGRPPPDLRRELESLTRELDMVYVPAYTSIAQRGGLEAGKVAAQHPDAATHAIIAERVWQAMNANSLLPEMP
ncbi:MAG: hypothetical protein V2J12_11220 [Gammaproteobacteria bacterium]|nr:hypothetical protein [Gammaproteobacteria bacterium]